MDKCYIIRNMEKRGILKFATELFFKKTFELLNASKINNEEIFKTRTLTNQEFEFYDDMTCAEVEQTYVVTNNLRTHLGTHNEFINMKINDIHCWCDLLDYYGAPNVDALWAKCISKVLSEKAPDFLKAWNIIIAKHTLERILDLMQTTKENIECSEEQWNEIVSAMKDMLQKGTTNNISTTSKRKK